MIIEQDQRQLHNAIALHTKASVRSLRLAQSRAWSRGRGTTDQIPAATFDIQFKPAGVKLVPGCLTLETDFTFVVAEEADEAAISESNREPIILIDCRFEAQYTLLPDYIPSDEEVEAFRTANAVFNCWPYFREYVQNTTTRMSFPPPAIPFLRLVPKVQHPVTERTQERATGHGPKKRRTKTS